MQITLIRHAKVLIENKRKIPASQMKAWVEEYNHAPIDKMLPSKEIISLIKNADIVLASSLSRTNDSLDVIGINPQEKNSLFDELDLPTAEGTFLKLHTKTWLVILRLMMLLGFGKNSLVFKESKNRAKKASEYLVALANTHESVTLIGHGGMNWLMGRVLEKTGWICVEDVKSAKNWGYKIYTKGYL